MFLLQLGILFRLLERDDPPCSGETDSPKNKNVTRPFFFDDQNVVGPVRRVMAITELTTPNDEKLICPIRHSQVLVGITTDGL